MKRKLKAINLFANAKYFDRFITYTLPVWHPECELSMVKLLYEISLGNKKPKESFSKKIAYQII